MTIGKEAGVFLLSIVAIGLPIVVAAAIAISQ